ncbi:hypothetical protein Lser_V15G44572 [Lactuca serriola]
MEKGDPKKLYSYENIEARVSYNPMHFFEKKPKRSYSIENLDMSQLDFPVNEMMIITAQYKIIKKISNEDDFLHMKIRFHAVVVKEPEELWSLVKIIRVINISKDVMFENMIQNFRYHVVGANNQACDFLVANFPLMNLNDLIDVSLILKDMDSSELQRTDKEVLRLRLGHIKIFIDNYFDCLALTDVELASALGKEVKVEMEATKSQAELKKYSDGEICLKPFGIVFLGKDKKGKAKRNSKMNRLDSKKNYANFKNHHDSKINVDPHPPGDGGGDNLPPLPAGSEQPERQPSHNGNKVYKSGPLFLSSKGIGWTSWKKRWFILTETSLVFFRSDPNASPQKAGDSNLTLGGIDLNSSGSVVVKADKKLLTVLFPDGGDGRAFTLKAETSEDLFEWKDALEAALSNAPSAGIEQGQNGTPKNEKGDTHDGSQEQSKDEKTKSIVLGRPILLALEDIDGTPSFLEKALCYVEDFGVNVEGILRQAADVDDVEHRIREYEQGKMEFTADEDGHVIGDCIKYVLREMPSPPVPASCCAALLEAYRTDRATKVGAIRAAICDTFPEPNRRLLQRILIMMEAVAENKTVNRMSVSAVAACMSPLLLRPLLAGEVDLGKGPDMGGDGSVQLLQAAAAANHAQAIVIILIEEYDKIFGEEDMLSDLYSDSDEYGSESEEVSDEYYEEDEDDEDVDVENRSERSCSYEDSESVSYSESGDDDHSKGSVSSNSFIIKKPKRTNVNVDKTKIKKGSPLESIDLVTEQQAEILRLEAAKIKLKERIEAEAKRNTVLKEDLVKKKNSLEARRVSLAEGVSRLEEELQKEKASQGAIQSSVDTNADPDDTHQVVADDSGLQNQPREQSSGSQPLSPDLGKVKDKEKDRLSKTTSHRRKETHSSKEHVDKNPFHSFSSKHPERSISKCTSSRRPPSKAEAANTTSALSKITNRLNFLKEKRTQIADDLQNVDKDCKTHKQQNRGSKKWSESPPIPDESHIQSSDKGKESSFQQKETSMDKGRSEDQSTHSR